MHTKFRFGLVLLSLFVGVAAASASDSIKVKSSRSLRVAVVDASKRDGMRDSVHYAFASSLGASIQRQGIPLAVKLSDQSSPANVAEKLASGAYDAVLIFDKTLPASLTGSRFSSTRGVAQVGVPVRVFHLVVRNGDVGLMTAVNLAFDETVKAANFQEALSRSAAIRVVANSIR
ncbi:MAG TPA: hypothetical protein VHO24_04185 [Opitutaceae bacterium]|nr:hypothetical protein [Opitutaceae bacterium]